jgi:hypothetical protein
VAVAVDAAASTVDAVTEEDRTTLAGARTAAKSGLCAALSINVFDYGHRAAVDQMRTSWEKLMQFVGTNYGEDARKQ